MWETVDISEKIECLMSLDQVVLYLKREDLIAIIAIMFVIKSLKGYGWNNVGPASQTVAKHYISIGAMYCVIWV